MAAILIVAAVTVHLPYGFSSIKLRSVTAAGPQFGPPGYETDLLYLAGTATLVIGGSGPFAVDQFLERDRRHRDGSRRTEPEAEPDCVAAFAQVGRELEASPPDR